MKTLILFIGCLSVLTSCSKDEGAILGKWATENLTLQATSGEKLCDANLNVAQSADSEYIVVLEHEGEILTFVSTSESDGIISIESIDDELAWDYQGDIRLVDGDLHLTYQYKSQIGAELPMFSSEGIFTKP